MTITIPLTRGLVTVIDDEDAPLVAGFKWYAKPQMQTHYAARSIRSPGGRGSKVTTQYMHTLLTGWPRVDHRNGDGLDNRRENLRPADGTQNGANRKGRKHASRFKGVGRQGKRWTVSVQGKYVGTFTDETVAARAYDEVARARYGEYAALNFPAEGERSAI